MLIDKVPGRGGGPGRLSIGARAVVDTMGGGFVQPMIRYRRGGTNGRTKGSIQ